MTALRLQATDPAVWDLTLRALADTSGKAPGLTYKCKACWGPVAAVGYTKFGPLFVSSWMDLTVGPLAFHDDLGNRMTTRADRKLSGGEVQQYGQEDSDLEHPEGVIALLELPANMAPDFPSLMVRCNDHGDAVLSRPAVLDQLLARHKKPIPIPLRARTRQGYVASSWTLADAERARALGTSDPEVHRSVERLGAPLPLEDVRRILDTWNRSSPRDQAT